MRYSPMLVPRDWSIIRAAMRMRTATAAVEPATTAAVGSAAARAVSVDSAVDTSSLPVSAASPSARSTSGESSLATHTAMSRNRFTGPSYTSTSSKGSRSPSLIRSKRRVAAR
ncbi:hypothetical protein FNH04_07380 [Streptomyces phyllanthi]|uniref:Uncharacterized protein n=1 Tax=Streptomyces phyllanthi TaxID=1803180 RepID=A0A5N8W0Q6_9ACTN|nr:hypothetical protein [Streptomyces phyllanthi]